MKERKNAVTMHGNPLTLEGKDLEAGDKAPDFKVLDGDLKEVTLADFPQKVLILSAVPSLDTPVCNKETRRFDAELLNLGPDVGIVTVSMDLPFAQNRWRKESGVRKIQTVSDHRDASFGMAYGDLIKELRLLARTVYVLDSDRRIRHIERVTEQTTEPDYNKVLSAVNELLAEEEPAESVVERVRRPMGKA